MIYATYTQNNQEKVGALSRDHKHIVSIESLYSKMNIDPPQDMNDFITSCNDSIHSKVESLLKDNTEWIALENVQLTAPIPYPKRNVICLGKNYEDHAMEVKKYTGGRSDLPKYPIYFTKSGFPIIGPEATILRHENATDQIDYEVELAVIIGKKGIDIPKEEAFDYIFGYSIGNDISARDLQKNHGNWFKGKSLNTHCSMGPWIVHKSVIKTPDQLDIKCWINDELRQNSNTKHLIFDIPYIISDLSKGMTLFPGDIIFTGTPAGVGLGFDPPKYLKPQDKVTCSIEKIGFLTNYIEK